MPTLEFFIPGTTATKQSGRMGNGGFYKEPNARQYESIIRKISYDTMKEQGLTPAQDAVDIEIVVYRYPPKSLSGKKTELALSGKKKPIARPDLDNHEKAVYDGMNKIVYRDDAQITDKNVKKRFSNEVGIYIKAQWEF